MTKFDAMEIDIIRCEVKRRTPLIALISDNINKVDPLGARAEKKMPCLASPIGNHPGRLSPLPPNQL